MNRMREKLGMVFQQFNLFHASQHHGGSCSGGYVYGHFKTIKGVLDRQMRIEKL